MLKGAVLFHYSVILRNIFPDKRKYFSIQNSFVLHGNYVTEVSFIYLAITLLNSNGLSQPIVVRVTV